MVFDVNIYLDVARIAGEPFSWDGLDASCRTAREYPVPHPVDAGFDSVRAIKSVSGGVLPDGRRVEVWTSDHINQLVFLKSTQPLATGDPEEDERDCGLGWSLEHANGLASNLVDELVWDLSFGDTIGEVPVSYGYPPLSNEDGRVYATARDAGYENVHYERFCVTRDRHFLDSELPGLIDVLHPSDWIRLVRSWNPPRPSAGPAGLPIPGGRAGH